MMTEDFDRILDECIDRINRGDNVADCLSDYPTHSEKLRPLLQSMHDIQKTYAFAPSADTKRAARQRFYATLGKQKRMRPVLSLFRVIPRSAAWATIAVLVLAIVGALVIEPVLNATTLVPSREGNFAFLIGDGPNGVGDLENLNLTISRVMLRPVGSEKWLRFTPEIKTVDLTQLEGGQTQETWRGHVPAGRYSHVRIYVSEAKGKLELTWQTIDLKVPGGVVHMPTPFEVTVDMVTTYTFAITAVATSDGRYILRLQIGRSGAQQEQKPVG